MAPEAGHKTRGGAGTPRKEGGGARPPPPIEEILQGGGSRLRQLCRWDGAAEMLEQRALSRRGAAQDPLEEDSAGLGWGRGDVRWPPGQTPLRLHPSPLGGAKTAREARRRRGR